MRLTSNPSPLFCRVSDTAALVAAMVLTTVVTTSGCAMEEAVPDDVGDGQSDDYGEDMTDDVAEPDSIPEIIERPDLRPGMEVKNEGGAGAIVPEPGIAVTATVLLEDGSSDELTIETREDGSVVEHRFPHPPDDEVLYRAGACGDRRFNLTGFAWIVPYKWRINNQSIPSRYNKRNVRRAIRRGASNITTSHNNCGMSDRVSARHSYRGTTSRRANFTSGGSCFYGDGRNVVDFGYSSGLFLAAACTFRAIGVGVESDVRFNSRYSFFASQAVPRNCRGRFDIEGIATHEFGHTFGLSHVTEPPSGLTMGGAKSLCSRKARTLGRGDVRGLRALY